MSDIKKRPNRKDYINKSTKIQLIADQELYIDYLESQQQTIGKLTKEVEELRAELSYQKETKDKFKKYATKEKIENTKLKEGLNDIKSQLFDVNNCDTILTSAIEQILKNK